MIKVKRVYDPPEPGDGLRVLVDRLWPRGVRRDAVDIWMREVAPSDELRRWFSHDPAKWEEFKARYWRELDENPKVEELLRLAERGDVTLLYAARSPYNNAVALKEYLERRLAERRG
ncbi:hypothetical protein TUZN_0794 [Thermoproteus uzoniensis 768-20]|uniref:Uroporphyrin-III C-methyltransferase n=1 Tax=Thermoproteus uzoniensis (strain 768-20) TaxID=999630 RepID=F2L533_THEU7|nr:DUF488 family protein [Thermoproteus uzoniensis]AEA12282.1 hypothetical protein TUZN_0794 [Thermoproteus uzoniensis 768-20]